MSAVADVEYLLIGSGVAASTVAMRLLAHDPDTSILMLEAGDEIPSKDRRAWWDFVVTGALPYDYTYDDDAQVSYTGNTPWRMNGSRVTAYGGTTMHWGGWALRMKPEDFRLRTNTGKGGDWLVGYDELEGYYCEAERHLSVCGDPADISVPRSEPFPLPPYPWLAADLEMFEGFAASGATPARMPLARFRKCMTTGTCRYCPLGARFSGQYVNDDLRAGGYPNFEIRTQATVTGIRLDSRRRARGVSYIDRSARGNGEVRQVDAAKVIICAGAFESPKLLMMSGRPFYDHGIGNDAGNVGRYLVSHSFLSVRGTAPSNPDRVISEYGFPTLMSRSLDDETRQATGKIFMFRNQNTPGGNWAQLMQAGKTRAQIDAIATGPRHIGISAFYEEFGVCGNYLRPIAGRFDRFGLPLMEIHFDRTTEVTKNAHLRLAEMEEIFRAIPDYVLDEKGSKFEGAAGFHASGTCRMSRTPEDGVTDGDLRVHGMDNLYVCSNAVFPSVGAVNPTLTLTALAFRLADHLAGGRPAPVAASREGVA